MQFDRNKAFPYPVLRPHSDDYAGVDFQATVAFEYVDERLKANTEYHLSSDDIFAEIQAGRAQFVSVISCRETYFQTTIVSADPNAYAEYPAGNFRGEVRIESYVSVKEEITDYGSEDINLEFGSGPFKFEVGDIMAQDEPQLVFIERKVFKPITSIFELVKSDHLQGGDWELSLDQDHIQVAVSQDMKEAIDQAKNNNSNRIVLLNSLYFAAVMQSVQKLKDMQDEYAERKWSEVIHRQAHNEGLDIYNHDAYTIAQRLLKSPLNLLNRYVFGGDE